MRGTVGLNCFVLFLGAVLGMTVHAALWSGEVIHWSNVLGNLIGGMIGAGGALLGVVVTMSQQEAKEQRLRLLQGAAMCVPLIQELWHIRMSAEFIVKHADTILGRYEPMRHPDDASMQAWAPVPRWLEIPHGAELKRNEDRLYLLGEEAAGQGVWILAELRSYANDIAELDRRRGPMKHAFDAQVISRVKARAQSLKERCETTYELLALLYAPFLSPSRRARLLDDPVAPQLGPDIANRPDQ